MIPEARGLAVVGEGGGGREKKVIHRKLGFPLPPILIVIFKLDYSEDIGNHAMKPVNENKGNYII